jgi:hypothetical protein
MSDTSALQSILAAQQELIEQMLQIGEQIFTDSAHPEVTVEQILELSNVRAQNFHRLEELTLPNSLTIIGIAETHESTQVRQLATSVQDRMQELLRQNDTLKDVMWAIKEKLGESVIQVQHALNLEGKYHPKRPPHRRGTLLDEMG